ncbi:SM-20 protein [Vibrio sp. JPW-9-11-11]|uniref:2OG-Fe(II) oxygenase n=1 Tax=Vibrio sp. JPW-9-11-11 TaxID=1416532 RepID=UPI001592DAC7|nr:2OG-Fe(II) oxygenase [Vibrio sp. JPW-9-11-11]NVD06811.1 SM-20 protein [Vibrio sp. JPW-9-11-11]
MNQLIDALFTRGYYIWDDFLPSREVERLRDCIPEQWRKARIGRNDEAIRATSVRSDKIQWLNPGMGDPVSAYLDKMEHIRLEVNRHFFLGLFEYEAHFAKYECGDFYQKHLDSFKGNENRRLTTVFYMNEAWQPQDAGELVIYDLQDRQLATVEPKAGRLLVFFSEQFPHEVKPTNTERYSIAGWFRVNGVSGNSLDIAN